MATKKEFEQKKEIEELKHKHSMEQLKYVRDTIKLQHQFQLEINRIKSAEIKRSIMLKSQEARYGRR